MCLSSKKAVFDNKKGIRGGIPVVFRKSLLYVHVASGEALVVYA